jgi:hypothetical protein
MPIILKLDVTKIDKAHLFQGKKGKYLDLVLIENRDGVDQYGNTHMIVQGVSKEAREAGVRGPILGNCKLEAPQQRGGQARQRPPQREQPPARDEGYEEEDIPF